MTLKTSKELLALRDQHIPQGPYNITSIVVEDAKGALIRDVEGREYIDFSGGIGAANVGHCRSEIVNVVKEQSEKFLHTCFHVAMYESYIELAEKLNRMTPGDFPKKTMFMNSGAEAVENAVKIARYASKRDAVIAFQNAYHGRTYMALSLTSQVKPYKQGFGPFCPEVYRMPYAYCYRCPFDLEYPGCDLRCADFMEDSFVSHVPADAVSAVIVEPIQGEGGFIVPPPGYLNRIQALCEKNEILFIVDEIQTGMGRTGNLFASEHFGLVPDMILTGKSLAAGLPLSGITGRAEIMDAPHVGGLGGTYSGNPVACKAALAVIGLLDDEMLEKAVRLGDKLRTRFLELQQRYEIIGDVRGLGPMIGMELVKDRKTKEPAAEETALLVRKCCEKGLIIISCGIYRNFIRTLIPFVITEEQLEKGLGILEESLRELCG